jgi:hypothetical protein
MIRATLFAWDDMIRLVRGITAVAADKVIALEGVEAEQAPLVGQIERINLSVFPGRFVEWLSGLVLGFADGSGFGMGLLLGRYLVSAIAVTNVIRIEGGMDDADAPLALPFAHGCRHIHASTLPTSQCTAAITALMATTTPKTAITMRSRWSDHWAETCLCVCAAVSFHPAFRTQATPAPPVEGCGASAR